MQGVKRMGQDSKSSESIWKMVMKHTGEYQTGGKVEEREQEVQLL